MVSVNHTKASVIGLDVAIQDIQTELYDFLTKKWGGAIQGFGRVYRTPKDGKIIPEWYNGKEYEAVYYNDNYACNFFFIDDQTHETKDGVVFEAKVKIAFMLNLEQTRPIAGQRSDEEVHNDVVKFLNNTKDGRFDIYRIQKTIDSVFYGFDSSLIWRNDMQPKHVFSVGLKLYYNLTNCN